MIFHLSLRFFLRSVDLRREYAAFEALTPQTMQEI